MITALMARLEEKNTAHVQKALERYAAKLNKAVTQQVEEQLAKVKATMDTMKNERDTFFKIRNKGLDTFKLEPTIPTFHS